MAAPTTRTTPDLLAGLNAQQREAAEAVRGPLCILAGAGSGKTRTVTHRIANQVATGVAGADQVLAVTFTERAARELRARLAALGIGTPVRAATFHAAAWAQLRHFWSRVADTPLPEVMASKLRLLVPVARRLHVEAADLAAEIEWAKARRVLPEAYPNAAASRDTPVDTATMAEVYAAYEAEKARRNAIDYEDMLLQTSTLLADHPDIAAEVRDRYRFFTVDEFQDVNPAQWSLLRAWLGDRDELCVVGDDDQTIYSFTGASSDYLTGFRSHFPGARVVSLTENYRSTPQVLALANRVLWTKPTAHRKRLTSRAVRGPEPILREFDDAEAERDAVVACVRTLVAEGIPPGEIAIFYRVNNQSQWFEEALADAGIPYTVRGEQGFFDRPEIRQAVAALRAAAESAGPATRKASDAPPPAGAAAVRPPRADREVETVLRDRLSWHPRRQPSGQAARERWRNLGQLLEVAALAVQADPETTVADLVADFTARAAAGQESPGPGGAVTLMTLHRAKGCEFDTVFLVACEEGLLPISYARTDAEVEEERRLLYVGVTRARRHLWVSWARSRPGSSGKPMGRRPSRFLYNLAKGAPERNRASRSPSAGPLSPGQPGDAAAADRLRGWRKDRAKRDGVPAFVVFNDRTLSELAARSPKSTSELLGVHGFGPAKARRYGEELLRVLREAQDGGPRTTH